MATTSITTNTKSLCLPLLLIISISTLAEANDVYIIHMDPSAMPKAFSSQHSWYMATLDSITSPNSRLISSKPGNLVPPSKLIYTYNHVVNGFSASLSPSELSSLENSPGFISATRDLPVKLDTSHTSQFLGLSPDSGAWQATNFGQGVIVGVVDTGLWPESESFSDYGITAIPSKWKGECEMGTQFNSSFCNKKLIGARSFSKGLIAHNPNIAISMNSTRDTDGHGTHTSSTAVGNYVDHASFFGYAPGTTKGMAPRAHVAMYKVGFDEGIYSSDIISGMDKAVEDGVDVISISLGLTGAPLYEDPVAIATFGAVHKGVFVSASAGNEGPFDGSIHNGTPWVLAVASSTLDREYHATLDLGNGVSVTGKSLYPGNYSNELLPIVFLGSCHNTTTINAVGKNKIVVCEDRNEALGEQFYNVGATNVGGGIFITNFTEMDFFLKSVFPAIFVNPEEGEKIKDFIKQSRTEPKAIMEYKKTVLGTKPAPTITSYSSRGPSPSCPFVLKPDVTAPGDLILASWPENVSVTETGSPEFFGKFNIISGTSMACPHAAGVAALVRAAHPDWSPAAVRSAIMTTSDITDNTSRPISDIGDDDNPATPLAMGAGHINPNNAIDPGLIYDTTTQDYINLLCALNFTQKQIKVITGSSSLSTGCSSPSLDLNYPSFIAFFSANDTKLPESSSTVKEFKRTVTNVGNGPASYAAKVTPIKGFKVNVVPERLVFGRKYETKSFEVKVTGTRLMKEDKAFGYLTWEDSKAKHVVRSPIVVTSLSSDVLPN